MKRITALDVLGQSRRARNILNRVIAYLEQQERAQRRALEKRAARRNPGEAERTARTVASLKAQIGEQG